MARQQTGSSLLELEAAQYFKLDLTQLNLGLPPESSKSSLPSELTNLECHSRVSELRAPGTCERYRGPDCRCAHYCDRQRLPRALQAGRMRKGPRQKYQQESANKGRPASNQSERLSVGERTGCRVVGQIEIDSDSKKTGVVVANQTSPPNKRHTSSRQRDGANVKQGIDAGATNSRSHSPVRHRSPRQLQLSLNGSTTNSTNSLPSISSSPSVSPSIVCPHLSLDDLLECRQGSDVSPHTIGLCPKCRTDPPPNVHSPLSPLLRPHSFGCLPGRRTVESRKVTRSTADLNANSNPTRNAAQQRMRRGYSDHQVGSYSKTNGAPVKRKSSNLASGRNSQEANRARDDSLDYALDPGELQRMQMSPTLRNSVEFIRKNSIESARVLKIYKNGEPFEKPLRVCILRGEFTNLNHFLDHINTRLLVPLGARYLFHLDGQLVYSVHELKHGSTYVVSGKRTFDYRANNQLRGQEKKEQTQVTCREGHEQKSARFEGRPDANKTLANRSQSDIKLNASSQSYAQIRDNVKPAVQSRAEESGNSRHQRRPQAEGPQTENAKNLRSKTDPRVASKEKPTKLIRAKSEFSALPKKHKKNVTFMDTSRGSSPALSKDSEQAAELVALDDVELGGDSLLNKRSEVPSSKAVFSEESRRQVSGSSEKNGEILIKVPNMSQFKEFRTSDVGIQVSDSIDGFLIDLPVALPAKGDDANVSTRPPLSRNSSSRRTDNSTAKSMRQKQPNGAKRRQIVTITERQLSLEEMNKLRDLSQGDHHHEPEVESEVAIGGTPTNIEAAKLELELIPDRTNTIAIGSDPQVDTGTQTVPADVGKLDAGRLVTTSQTRAGLERRRSEDGHEQEHWQYPGGQAASDTPTERPVSQSGPSETVRARVTTPTPSLSTGGGDNNSLSMSYEEISSPAEGHGLATLPRLRTATGGRSPAKMPAKRRPEVTGTLCAGLYEPTKNFRLVWVNGFAINDLYPDNSVSGQQLFELERARSSSPAAGAHLSPEYLRRHTEIAAASVSPPSEFKSSERYHNYVCHSRRYNELIYPAGSLVVLWCQWTNEQRYYARHTSNVSSVALSTLDLDLAASAQVCELSERPPIVANIHLWSTASLETLAVIEDEQLRTKLIFSLRLKNSKNNGFELSVGARDDKQMFLMTLSRRLQSESERTDSLAFISPARRSSKESALGGISLHASKVLQSNQVPLFIMKVPNISDNFSQVAAKPEIKLEPVITFGRRCFQIWVPDLKQRKLRPMQQANKSTQFTKLMLKASCLCRLSPSELLAGDSDGNVALLLVDLALSSPQLSGSELGTKRQLPKLSPSRESRAAMSYSVETVALLGPDSIAPAERAGSKAANQFPGITCLTRITGSLFMGADSTCTVRFWRIKRRPLDSVRQSSSKATAPTVRLAADSSSTAKEMLECEQLTSISLPPDLGFICTIILANYNRANSLVEFYIVSTCNTILFGSVKLHRPSEGAAGAVTSGDLKRDLLANSSLSVVYEGHETSATSLVADCQTSSGPDMSYFTCSLDCRICKWTGTRLVWKSMLPSPCVSLAVHPTGFVLAVGSIDGTVYVLDKLTGLLISYFPLTPVRINCLAFSSDGSLLAAGCANGSIFILPVYEGGLKYKKVSIFQSPHAVVSLQFSLDNRYILTSVTHGSYQELILWDLPNFRYMRDNVKLIADKIQWFDSICSGSEEVRAIWENANLSQECNQSSKQINASQRRSSGPADTTGAKKSELRRNGMFVVNLSCHRLVKTKLEPGQTEPGEDNLVIASDTRGYLRLFRYPCYDIQQGFYAARISSTAVNCCRFLKPNGHESGQEEHFVSTSVDGSICLWKLEMVK